MVTRKRQTHINVKNGNVTVTFNFVNFSLSTL